MMVAIILSIVGGTVLGAMLYGRAQHKARNVEEWALGGRRMGTLIFWFLNAGEIYTTFAVLGISGFAWAYGAPAYLAFCSVSLSAALGYWLTPRIHAYGRHFGLLTQADYFTQRYQAPWLGVLVGIAGIVALLVYIQIQITALTLIVQLAAGSAVGSGIAAVIAVIAMLLFVYLAGLRSAAFAAGVKDVLAGADIVERGATYRIESDIAAMCFGFLPQSDLPRAAGADVRWADPAGGWETVHDGGMRSSVPGLYVAGETSGVTGADAALLEGALAGVAMAADAGRISPADAKRLAAPLRRKRARLRAFVDLLRTVADPRGYLSVPAPDTLVGRCEDVSPATLDAAIADAVTLGTQVSASAVKLRCRAGMGLCQGRSCEWGVMQRIAAATGAPMTSVPGFRPRYPARPMPIADLVDPA